jgi:hypothetical protein
MRGVLERPEGLDYRADMLSPDEEREVLAVVERLDLREVQMRGQTARRTVQHFDLEYGYESWQLAPAEPLPESLEWLRERCAEFASIASAAFAQTLVTRYPPGATIGWHRDAPVSGPWWSASRFGRLACCASSGGWMNTDVCMRPSWRRARPTSSPAAPARRGSTASRRCPPCGTRSRSALFAGSDKPVARRPGRRKRLGKPLSASVDRSPFDFRGSSEEAARDNQGKRQGPVGAAVVRPWSWA